MNPEIPPSQPPAAGRWRRAADDVADGARRSAPHVKRAAERVLATLPAVRRGAARVGDWLGRIGWGKFFLLAILVLIFGGIVTSILETRQPAVVIERGPRERVNLNVAVSPEGVRITPGTGPATPPRPPIPPRPPGAEAPAAAAPEGGRPSVSVDDRGVHIRAERDGKQVAIQIDGNGVRIAEDSGGSTASGSADGVVIPPAAAQDPEKLAEALDSARDKIEQIVNEQIDRQVARQARAYKEQTSDWFMTFVMLLIVSAIIVKVVLGSKKKAEIRAQAATATAAEEGLKRQLAEAQLKMMQAQVEPHFLFNTLASVDYLIETDPTRASAMQKHLIQYLRAALPQMREGSTTLGKEVALCRSYLEILRVRMEDRLQFAINVPQGLASAQFPPMMLQSLVENAIQHGLEPKPEGGTLTLSADIAHGSLRVTVADTGLGFGAAASAGTGVGLSNVRERLAALYGSVARLSVQGNTPTGTIATIEVPYVIEGGAAQKAPPDDVAPQPA